MKNCEDEAVLARRPCLREGVEQKTTIKEQTVECTCRANQSKGEQIESGRDGDEATAKRWMEDGSGSGKTKNKATLFAQHLLSNDAQPAEAQAIPLDSFGLDSVTRTRRCLLAPSIHSHLFSLTLRCCIGWSGPG